jgi:hypothetical protein
MAVLFIDESKSPNYIFAAVLIQESELPRLRKALRNLLIAGQRSIHFKKEQAPRRRKLVSVFERHGFQAIIFRSIEKQELNARFDCLEQLVKYSLAHGVSRIILERDDSVFRFDEATLYSLVRRFASRQSLGFEHSYRHEEPLLWVADSIAWCANQNGDWQRRIEPLLLELGH